MISEPQFLIWIVACAFFSFFCGHVWAKITYDTKECDKCKVVSKEQKEELYRHRLLMIDAEKNAILKYLGEDKC